MLARAKFVLFLVHLSFLISHIYSLAFSLCLNLHYFIFLSSSLPFHPSLNIYSLYHSPEFHVLDVSPFPLSHSSSFFCLSLFSFPFLLFPRNSRKDDFWSIRCHQVLRESAADSIVLIGAGVTIYEAIKVALLIDQCAKTLRNRLNTL